MGKYLRISSYIRPYIYMALQLLHSEFHYICGKFYFLFNQCTVHVYEGLTVQERSDRGRSIYAALSIHTMALKSNM
jgi:hypothetical protein